MTQPTPTVKVNINGEDFAVPQGARLIDAARDVAGVEIPHFCYHPHLSVAGNCRMCAVEIEGQRGLPISCNTTCDKDGMKVLTESDRVKAARKSVMEFLLVNHPIDCPICDQAGECKLQIYYMDHDLQPSRLEVDKVHYGKRIEIGPRVVLDQERCVECTRCIRFCDEVTHTSELRMVNRGDHNIISTFPGTSLDNDYSVNTADICPVGALTSADFRFQARAWFLKPNATVCPGCSKGCNVNVDYYDHMIVTDHNGKAYRLKPRVNEAVNKAWMCDAGRDEYKPINDDRVVAATVNGTERPADDAAIAARAALTKAGSAALIVTSLDATVEEMEALRRLGLDVFGAVRTVAVAVRPDGKADALLMRADKHPNRKGAEWVGVATDRKELAALLRGKQAVLVHRADLSTLDADGSVMAAFAAVPTRVVIAANTSPVTEKATHLLPAASFIEREGHWFNEDGRVQRMKRAYRARKGTREDLAFIAVLGGGRIPAEARTVFADLATVNPHFAGLTWESVGALGALPGVAEGVAV